MTRINRRIAVALVALAGSGFVSPVLASDLVTVAVDHRGNWDTSIAHLGSRAGIFKKYGIELEIAYTHGSGETVRAVTAGNADIGLAVGALGAISAFLDGAPIRIIGAQATGAADYWYAKTTSAIRTLDDTADKTIAFSTKGSSTDSIVRALIAEFGLSAKPVPTGNPAATLAAVMADQVDVGWASPPFGFKEMEDGRIRLIAKASDASIVRGQTLRVAIATKPTLDQRGDVVRRFMQAYRESIDHMYSESARVIADYASFAGVPEPTARRVRDDFFPKSLLQCDDIKGLPQMMQDAVQLKFIPAPLSKEQLAELIVLQPPITH